MSVSVTDESGLEPVDEGPTDGPPGSRSIENLLGRTGKRVLSRFPRLYTAVKRAWISTRFRFSGNPIISDLAYLRRLEGTEGLFVDVGANAGQSALSVAKVNSSLRILAFEPNPDLEADLRTVKRLLGDRFTYKLVALSETTGETAMLVPTLRGSSLTQAGSVDAGAFDARLGHLEDRFGTRPGVRRTVVKTLRFDELELVPTVVKMSVEGAELTVLKGMTRTLDTSRPLLRIDRNVHTHQVLPFLEERGYRIARYDRATNDLIPCEDLGRAKVYWAVPSNPPST